MRRRRATAVLEEQHHRLGRNEAGRRLKVDVRVVLAVAQHGRGDQDRATEGRAALVPLRRAVARKLRIADRAGREIDEVVADPLRGAQVVVDPEGLHADHLVVSGRGLERRSLRGRGHGRVGASGRHADRDYRQKRLREVPGNLAVLHRSVLVGELFGSAESRRWRDGTMLGARIETAYYQE